MRVEQQIEALKQQLDKIDELHLQRETSSSQKFARWCEATKRQIKRIFGEESEQLKRFGSIHYVPWGVILRDKQRQRQKEQEAFLRGLEAAKTQLLVMTDELNEQLEFEETDTPSKITSTEDKRHPLFSHQQQSDRDKRITSKKRQLAIQIGNRDKLREEIATYGTLKSAPLKLQNDLEEIEKTITELEIELGELEDNT